MKRKFYALVFCASFFALVTLSFSFASAAPVISNVRVPSETIMSSGAQVRWSTDVPANSIVKYGPAYYADFESYPYYSDSRCDGGGYVTDHCVNLTGLAASTIYYYGVKSVDASSSVSISNNSSQFFTSAGGGGGDGSVPMAPSNLRLDPAPTPTAIYLKWNDNSSNEDKFNVEREVAGSASWMLLIQTGANVTSYTDIGVTSGATYNYRVQACQSGYGCSEYAYYFSAVVPAGGGSAPSAPSSFVATSANGVDIALSWVDNSSNEQSFKIWRRFSGETAWTFQAEAGANVAAWTINSQPAGSYDFRLEACNSYGCSASVYASVTVSGSGGGGGGGSNPPPVPSGISGTSSGSTGVSYTYSTYLFPDPDGNQVKAVFDWGDGTAFGETSPVYPVTGGTYVSLSHAWPTAGTYYVKVKAKDSSNLESGWSGTFTVTIGGTSTSTATNIPAAPSGLSGSYVSNGAYGPSVNLLWTDKASNETEFKLFRRSLGGTWVFVQSYGADTVSVQIAALDTSNIYEYKVQACNVYGCSGDSNTVAITNGSVGAIPTVDLKVDNVDGTVSRTAPATYTLTWTTTNNPAICEPRDTWANSGNKTVPSGTWYFTGVTVLGLKTYTLTCANSYGSSSDTVYVNIISSTTTSTTTAGSIPSPPSSLRLDPQPSATAIYMKWNDNSSNEDKFNVEREIAGSGSWTFLYQTGANATAYTDTSVTSGTTYNYRVQACQSGYGCSSYAYLYSVSLPSAIAATAPVVAGWGLAVDSAGVSTIGISFSSEMDQNTFTGDAVYLYSASDPSTRISASIKKFPYYVNLISNALVPNAEYVSVVRTSVKNKQGIMLATEYQCKFFALPSGSYLTSCPGGGVVPSRTTTETTLITVAPSRPLLKGTVLDAAGLPVPNAGVHIFSKDFSSNFGAQTLEDGSFALSLSSGGTYLVELFPPFTRGDLIKSTPQEFSVASGETKTLTLRFSALAKTMSGKVAFSDGVPVTDAEVGAYNETSKQWRNVFTDAQGKYALLLGGGKWNVGIRPRDPSNAKWRWSGILQEVAFRDDDSKENRTIDFTVSSADVRVVVRAIDQAGNSITGANIVLDTISSGTSDSGTQRTPPLVRQTDAQGIAAFSAPAGRYFVRASLPPERGFVAPAEQEIQPVAGQTISLIVVFRRQDLIAQTTINGVARLGDGRSVDAFIWAWSDKGGFVDGRAGQDGTFSLRVPTGSTWRVGGGKELDGFAYKSTEITVSVVSESVQVEIVLTKAGEQPLPQAVTVSQEAQSSVVVQAQDGARVIVPPQAAASSGTINVEVRPTAETPSQPAAKVVSTAYDVSIRDQGGNSVSSLQKEIEIQLPYKEEDLKAQGITEDQLVPSFFDETANIWTPCGNYTIDKQNNIAVCRVKHLTRFALVAAADVTPPAAPTNVAATAAGEGKVALRWVNPTSDFRHVKIYRSSVAGELGSVVFAEVLGVSQEDKGLADGARYYYVVRAVDPAGNESTNINQVSVVVSGQAEVASVSGIVFSRNLTLGSKGDDVMALQQLLVKEGVYPEGIISGVFGQLTKAAVARFQDKYAAEVLAPAGLSQGSGFVGMLTRKKLNELTGVSSKSQPEIPPGQAVKAEILRTLSQGDSGDDVKALQEILITEGVYPEGLVTGFFGNLTRQAVIRFQEKYADEILVPVGLAYGTGIVGPSTRAKLNSLR